MKKLCSVLVLIFLVAIFTGCSEVKQEGKEEELVKVKNFESTLDDEWQAEVKFPDWKGYIDDTLAMNSMYSFDGFKDQGKVYITADDSIRSYDCFINNYKVDTSNMLKGSYEIDISKIAKNGINTIQISNINSYSKDNKVTVRIPYPRVIDGTLEEVGLRKEPFELIEKIIQSDINNGFSSAQLAVIKDGKLVYQNAWGLLNSYNKNGSRIEDGVKVTNDTMYDLASNTKMYSVAYAIQNLIYNNKLNLEDKIVDLLGNEFVDNTIEVQFASFGEEYPGLDIIKGWKSEITVQDLLMHRAGFPDSGHYHNEKFDIINQTLSNSGDNPLFVADATKEKTFKEGICKTPLIYEPRTKILYSDIDYMLLGILVEKVTKEDLNTFLSKTFWQPMGLTRITYNPLENGFSKDDCAATELNGNTRDDLIFFPNVRKDTIQGEVHDEESYYMMEGISGHAGLFSNATDLAKLASVMLTGGYGKYKFFSKDIRDVFVTPKASSTVNYGIGWWREADDKRVWYFGTQSPESTIGHQGWTGTLTMIDFENNMVVVYLTNSINTPIVDNSSIESANDFAGRYYTASTLGFVPQLIYMGLENNSDDLNLALESIATDMAKEKQSWIDNKESKNKMKFVEDHPVLKAKKALDDVLEMLKQNSVES